MFSIPLLAFALSSTAQAAPTFIKHTYKQNDNIHYYSLKSVKYKTVNHRMKLAAKKAYGDDIKNKKWAKEINADYPFYNKLKPTIKYQTGNRISILTKETWYAGGPFNYLYTSYNLVDGKQITLKQAFKSTTTYKKANLQIAKKINKKFDYKQFNKYGKNSDGKTALQLVDAFYWSEKGLYVVYSTNTIASTAAQQQTFKVSHSYSKYYK